MNDVRMSTTSLGSRLVFDLDAPVQYLAYASPDARRLQIRIPHAVTATAAPTPLPGDRHIGAIRFTSGDDSLAIQIDLERPARHKVLQLKPYAGHGDRLVVDIEGIGERPAATTSDGQMIVARAGDQQVSGPADRPGARLDSTVSGLQAPPGKDDDLSPRDARIRLSDRFYFGGRLETEYSEERNYDLNKSRPDDLAVWESLLSLVFAYRISDNTDAFVSLEPTFRDIRNDDRRRRNDTRRLELKQAYLAFDQLADGLHAAVGRQPVEDQRTWLFDEELDAITVRYDMAPFQVNLLAGENRHKDLINDGKDEKIRHYGLFGRYIVDEDNEIDVYGLYQHDRTRHEAQHWYIGAHAHGEAGRHVDYWFDGAIVRGREEGRRIRGYGFDLGATYAPKLRFRPNITLAYAFGSGDKDPDDGVDRNFRQTGLQDNEAKFAGLESIKYYGEAFDPELSNLQVFTLGLGTRPYEQVSVDLVFHRFYQHRAFDEIRDAEIDKDPDGEHRHLGDELDLIAAFRSQNGLKLSAALGLYRPRDAYPDDDEALFCKVKLRYRF